MIEKISDQAAELIKAIEVLALQPYDDQTGKPIKAWCKGATIGYGHLIGQNEWDLYKNGISKAYADALFRKDAAIREAVVVKAVKADLSQQQFDALVILVFNIGESAFKTSSVLKLINSQPGSKYRTLDDAWKAFNKSQGQINKGLINRRACELDIWHNGAYQRW